MKWTWWECFLFLIYLDLDNRMGYGKNQSWFTSLMQSANYNALYYYKDYPCPSWESLVNNQYFMPWMSCWKCVCLYTWICLRWFFTLDHGKSPSNHPLEEHVFTFSKHRTCKSKKIYAYNIFIRTKLNPQYPCCYHRRSINILISWCFELTWMFLNSPKYYY